MGHDYASYSNSLADVRRRIRSWIRNARQALTQAPHAPLDVFAVRCGIARHHVRACPSRVLRFNRRASNQGVAAEVDVYG
jgi:hypothetical protein